MKMQTRIALFLLIVFALVVTTVVADEHETEDDVVLFVLASSAITFDDDGLSLADVPSVTPVVFYREDGPSYASIITEGFDASFGYEEDLIASAVFETETFQMNLLVRTVPGYDASTNPVVVFEVIEFVSGTEYVVEDDAYIEVEIDKFDDFYGTFEGVIYISGDQDFLDLFVAGLDAYYEDTRTTTTSGVCTNPRAC